MPGGGASVRINPSDLGIGALFALINDAVVVGEARTGQIVLWNPGAQRIFGYTPDEVIGKPLATLVPERMRASHEGGLRRFAESGVINLTKPGETIEVPAVTATGEEILVELSLAAIPSDVDGKFVIACIRDVTERHRAQETLRNFVAVAAHDLRSPLTALSGGLDIFRSVAPELSEQADEVLAIVERQADAITRLVLDLLDVAQLDAQQVEPRPARVLLRETMDLAGALVADATFTITVEPNDLAVTADPTHTQRILVNLAANASRHGSPPFTMHAARRGDAVEIRVHDSGAGVPAEFEAVLFDRFARQGMHAGSGLGLAIARGLARANGGDVRYEGSGDGASFVVTLPAA